MIIERGTMMVEENIAENLIWRNRGKYVQRFKDATWNGLQRDREREYITAFRERHIMQHKSKSIRINVVIEFFLVEVKEKNAVSEKLEFPTRSVSKETMKKEVLD